MSAIIKSTNHVTQVTWPDGTQTLLPHLWLRDNCDCDECRVTQTTEKKFHIAGVSVDLNPEQVRLEGDQLELLWPDGHTTTYLGSDIRALLDQPKQAWVPWSSEFQPRRTDFQRFIDEDAVAAATITDFLNTGAAVLIDAPQVPNTVETLSQRLGPIRHMAFDRIHDVVVNPHGYNVAFTALPLPPHNDLASFSWPPSTQALHMLVNEVVGGESIIVDGWRIAVELQRDHPEMFQVLCKTPVPFRIFDDHEETFVLAPVISCDAEGDVSLFRYSNQTMQAIDPTRPGLVEFYRAYHEVSRRVMAESSKAKFRLEGGQILIVAGHRVLHARAAFDPTGRRHLQDAYFDHDNVRNHLVVLRRRMANRVE